MTGAATTRAGGDRGAVTAELAVTLPAVVLVVAVLLVTVGAGGLQLRAAEAARTAARVAALGEDDAAVAAAGRHVLPGARITVTRDPPWVTVTVATTLDAGWLTGVGLPVGAEATAWVEP